MKGKLWLVTWRFAILVILLVIAFQQYRLLKYVGATPLIKEGEDYPLPEIDPDVFEGWKDAVAPLLPDDWNQTLLDGNGN
jgi:hypothetical protein